MNLARTVRKDKPYLQWTRLQCRSLALAAAEPLEACAGRPRRACRRARRAAARASPPDARSRKNVCDERFATSRPAVPSTVASDETSSTRSRARCSAASRSSSVSASGAKRTASGPSSASSPAPSKTTTPRAPLRRDEARERVDELAAVGRTGRRAAGCSRRRGRASARPSAGQRRAGGAPRRGAPPRRR